MTIVSVRGGVEAYWEVVDSSLLLSLAPLSLVDTFLDAFDRLPFWKHLCWFLTWWLVALVFLVPLCQFRRVGGGRGL